MCEEYKILNLLSTEKIIFSNYDGHYIECDDKEITLYLTNENIIFTYGRAGHKSFNIKKYSLLDIVCVLLNTKEYNDKIEQYPTLKICFKNQEVLFEFEEIEFSEKWSELIRIALCEKLPIGKSLCPECGAILDTQPGYAPNNNFWDCIYCETRCYSTDIYNGEMYPDVFWYCDRCNALMNIQPKFTDTVDKWKCKKCGYINNICLFEDDEDYSNKPENCESQSINKPVEKDKFCIYCGNKIDEDDIFCIKCGKKIN